MTVNRYTILTPRQGDTGSTINIPLNQGFQIVDNSDIITTQFIDEEIDKAVNIDIDYEKVRFSPIITGVTSSINMDTVSYQLYFYDNQNSSYYDSALLPTKLSDIGYEYQDLYFNKNSAKKSYLRLYFYNNDDQTTQTLVSSVTIRPNLRVSDNSEYLNKRSSFELKNPLTSDDIYTSGFFIYYFKDEVEVQTYKNLYMKATYFNAKTGKMTNFMTQPIPGTLSYISENTFTQYNLHKDQSGYLYSINDTYSNNVSTSSPSLVNYIINLYEIKTI